MTKKTRDNVIKLVIAILIAAALPGAGFLVAWGSNKTTVASVTADLHDVKKQANKNTVEIGKTQTVVESNQDHVMETLGLIRTEQKEQRVILQSLTISVAKLEP